MSNREPETWEQRITLTSVGSEEVKWAIEDVEYGLDLISGDLPDVFCRDLVLGKSPEATFHCRYMELPQPGARHVALDGDTIPKGTWPPSAMVEANLSTPRTTESHVSK